MEKKKDSISLAGMTILLSWQQTYTFKVLPSKTGRFPVSIDTFSEKIQMVFQFSWVAVGVLREST